MLVFEARPFGDHGPKGPKLDFVLARAHNQRYKLFFGRRYGMAASREWAILNASTPSDELLALSDDGRPLIWLDSDLDRDPRNLGPSGGIIGVLPTCSPAAFKITGEKKEMRASIGGMREAHEVEILLEEGELAHSCYYCGLTEYPNEDEEVYEQCGGEGYTSIYWCSKCSKKAPWLRFLSRLFLR